MPTFENDSRCSRLSAFKNKGKNPEEMRRRRNEVNVELRKARKDDQLQKRRNIGESDEPGSPLQESNCQSQTISMTLEEIIEGVTSADPNVHLKATQAARRTLSRERNPPIDTMINSGIVPRLVEFLSHFDNPTLQFEAAWALTNIASGNSNQTYAVIKSGAIAKLVALLSSSSPHVSEQAVWALGNIAGDGPNARDMVINEGAVKAILRLVNPNTTVSFLRNIVWTISNLCRNKNPPPPFEMIKPCLGALQRLLFSEDNAVLADACWALSYLTDGSNEKIQAVIDVGVVPRLIELLKDSAELVSLSVLTPALRTVGNIVTGNDAQTDVVVLRGLGFMKNLLKHGPPNVKKEAAWTISNITAGNAAQIQAVIDAGIIPELIEVISNGDAKSQKEAAWAVTNLTSGGLPEHIVYLVNCGVLKPMCNLLDTKDSKVIVVVLDGLANILQCAEKEGHLEQIAIIIEECGGLDKLEALQTHKNEEIYVKALNLIDSFFSNNGEDSSLLPSEGQGEFNFNNIGSVPDGGFSF